MKSCQPLLLLVLLATASLSACAQSPAPENKAAAKPAAAKSPANAPAVKPGTAEERALAAIRSLNAQVQIDRIGAAPLPGFREVIVGGQVIYVSDDGRYLLQGALFDVDAKKDLSQAGLAEVRRERPPWSLAIPTLALAKVLITRQWRGCPRGPATTRVVD